MPSERGEEAAKRAGAALARAQELADRLTELHEGRPTSQASYERAARSAHEAVDHAVVALRKAAQAHHRAADLHRRIADLLDKLGQPDRAAEHRRLAEVDDAEGDADEAGASGGEVG